jgi:hypothetical protein
VPRSPFARVLGFLLALTTAFATPATALAHGHAHEHEAEEHAAATTVYAHDGSSSDAHSHHDAAPALRVATADRDGGDHPHAFVDASLTTKGTTLLVVLMAAYVALPVSRVVATSPPTPHRTLQFRAEAAHAPPPRLRAPPALLG